MAPWTTSSRASRPVAAAIALALTLGFLALLQLRPNAKSRRSTPPPGVLVLMPPAMAKPSTTPGLAEAPRSRGPRPEPQRALGATTREPIRWAPAPPLPADDRPATPVTAAAEPMPPAASAPLRLDTATIQRALAGTEGNVRRLARDSGATLDMPRATTSERLAASVAETAVPDCLAPHSGGSLLSIPVIAYRALDGKCK